MPDIFDIDFSVQEQNLMPPPKRFPIMMAFVYACLYPYQYLRDIKLGTYKYGASYASWAAGTAYVQGNRIIYSDRAVYEAQGNVTGAGNAPGLNTIWFKIQDNFIGADERVKYNSQIIVLEYALNNFFQTGAANPQIYLQTNPQTNNIFVMGSAGKYSSAMPNNSSFSNAFMWSTPAYSSATTNLTVNVPNGILATLGATLTDQINIIRAFVDKYVLTGITYNVIGF